MRSEQINVDCRVLAAAIRYSIPRNTSMIDITIESLEQNLENLEKWLLKAIISDMEYHLRGQEQLEEKEQVNVGYANRIIFLCERAIKLNP